MKQTALAAVVAALVAGTEILALGAHSRNPFLALTEAGDYVRILPLRGALRDTGELVSRQPTFAPVQNGTAVYPPSYGSGNLIDHGGFEMSNAGFWAIYWNAAVAGSTETSASTTAHYDTIQSQMNAFIDNFPDNANWDGSETDDYSIVQQYGSRSPIAPTLTNWGAFVDSRATMSVIYDFQLRTYLSQLFNAGSVPARTDTIYGIYLPPGMKVRMLLDSSCTTFCGYHGHFRYGTMQIKYAVFPYLNCGGCTISGLTVGDMLTIVTSHEIREAVTDPGDFFLGSWFDSTGFEADDKCAWHNLYQMTRGGFFVQPEFSNGGTRTASGFTATYPGPGCVVPNQQ